MITAGIKELKANLSSFVDKVQLGEEIVVTDRGREVALLIPITPERRQVRSLINAGKAKWAGGKPKGLTGIRVEGGSVADTLLEERR